MSESYNTQTANKSENGNKTIRSWRSRTLAIHYLPREPSYGRPTYFYQDLYTICHGSHHLALTKVKGIRRKSRAKGKLLRVHFLLTTYQPHPDIQFGFSLGRCLSDTCTNLGQTPELLLYANTMSCVHCGSLQCDGF